MYTYQYINITNRKVYKSNRVTLGVMNKIFTFSLIVLILTVGYVLAINELAKIMTFSTGYAAPTQIHQDSGTDVQLGISDGVQVTVLRNRFYGRIREVGDSSKLSLFGYIPVPLKSNGYSLMVFHYIFLIIILLFTMYYLYISILIKTIERRHS
jgi:hypothetical protein